MVLLNCFYGNNNTFTLKISESIEYGTLYQIIARILNIKETNIAYIIYSGKIVGSKQLPFTNLINLHYPIVDTYIILGNSVKMNAKYLHYSLDDDAFSHNNDDIFAIKISEEVFYKNISFDINLLELNAFCFCGELLSSEFHKCCKLKCGHLFHENCIKQSIIEYDRRGCPLCGANVITLW
jgi:hypothetical protein